MRKRKFAGRLANAERRQIQKMPAGLARVMQLPLYIRRFLLRLAVLVTLVLNFPLAAYAAANRCHLGNNLELEGKSPRKCVVVGHSTEGLKGSKTFYASCSGQSEDAQIEYLEGSKIARLVDVASRREMAICNVDQAKFSTLIRGYQHMGDELENPKCYLTQWKGQMMYVAAGVKGRCSFNMSRKKSEEFKNKTGVVPLYQCEHDYFLSIGERTAASIYKRSKDGWELDCKATIRVGEPVETIDWKNPPQYYVPEAGVSGPTARRSRG